MMCKPNVYAIVTIIEPIIEPLHILFGPRGDETNVGGSVALLSPQKFHA